MHRVDDEELAKPLMCDPFGHQGSGDDTDDLAALGYGSVGEHTHQTDMSAAVDDSEVSFREQ